MTNNEPAKINRLEATQEIHSQILNELAVAHRELAEFSTRQASRQQQQLDRHDAALIRLSSSATQHDQALTRIEDMTSRNSEAITNLAAQAERHDQQLFRMEGAITDLTTQMNYLGRRVDALTTSTTETLRLVADNSIQIRRIWERLGILGNGRG